MVICTPTMSRSVPQDQSFIKASKLLIDVLIEFLKDNNLEEQQRKDFLIPCMWKEEKSIVKPFELQRQLKLIAYEKKTINWPFSIQGIENAEEQENYVKKISKFYEAFTGAIIRAGFEKQVNDLNKADQLYNEFYEKYHKRNQDSFDLLKSIEPFNYIYMTLAKF